MLQIALEYSGERECRDLLKNKYLITEDCNFSSLHMSGLFFLCPFLFKSSLETMTRKKYYLVILRNSFTFVYPQPFLRDVRPSLGRGKAP